MLTQKEIVEELKMYMRTHNINQSEIARRIGVNQCSVSNWLSGKKNINLKNYMMLLDLMWGKL